MSEISKFTSGDNRFIFTVKSDFLAKCPDYAKIDTYELMTKYKLNQYLHNPTGPAIQRLKDGFIEYWIDGQVVPKEVGAKIAHTHQFNEKLTSVISDETE